MKSKAVTPSSRGVEARPPESAADDLARIVGALQQSGGQDLNTDRLLREFSERYADYPELLLGVKERVLPFFPPTTQPATASAATATDRVRIGIRRLDRNIGLAVLIALLTRAADQELSNVVAASVVIACWAASLLTYGFLSLLLWTQPEGASVEGIRGSPQSWRTLKRSCGITCVYVVAATLALAPTDPPIQGILLSCSGSLLLLGLIWVTQRRALARVVPSRPEIVESLRVPGPDWGKWLAPAWALLSLLCTSLIVSTGVQSRHPLAGGILLSTLLIPALCYLLKDQLTLRGSARTGTLIAKLRQDAILPAATATSILVVLLALPFVVPPAARIEVWGPGCMLAAFVVGGIANCTLSFVGLQRNFPLGALQAASACAGSVGGVATEVLRLSRGEAYLGTELVCAALAICAMGMVFLPVLRPTGHSEGPLPACTVTPLATPVSCPALTPEEGALLKKLVGRPISTPAQLRLELTPREFELTQSLLHREILGYHLGDGTWGRIEDSRGRGRRSD